MAKRSKPRPVDDDGIVYEAGLATGSGELGNGIANDQTDRREIFSGQISPGGGTSPFTYSLVSVASGRFGTLSLDQTTGAYTYTLARAIDTTDADNGAQTETGQDVFTYRVTDSLGEVGSGTIAVDIVDDVPHASADTNVTVEGGMVSGNLLTDGADDLFGADGAAAGGGLVGIAAGSATSIPVTGGMDGAAIEGAYGTLTVDPSGSYSYRADPNLAAGSGLVDQFVYSIRDGDGDTSTASLQIAVGEASAARIDARDFGAIGDGLADDTAEIQAAIDAAYAAGGGTVYLAAGTYKLSGTTDKSDGCIQLRDNVILQGEGIGLTILKVQNSNPNTITGIVRTPYNEVTHDVGLFDLTIDGNRANNVNKIDGFYCGVAPGDTRQDYDITIERVEIMNCTGYGFDPHEQTLRLRIADSVSHHNGLDGFVADFLIDSVFEDNLAYSNDRHGFNVTTSTDNLLLLNNVAHDNGSAGLAIQRGSENIPEPHDIIVQGGAFYDNAREGIYVKIADDVTITGAEVYGNKRQGIRLDGAENVLIDDVTVSNNSQEGAGIYDEIRINRYNDTAGSSGLIFDSNDVDVRNSTIIADGPVRSRYGIAEALDVNGFNTQSGNIVTGVTGSPTYFAPQLATPASNQTAAAGQPFSYQLAAGSFFDADDPALVLSAKLASGINLPAWLTFDAASQTFSGTPTAGGTYDIVVKATDPQGLATTTTFQLVATGPASNEIRGTSGADTLIGGVGADTIYGYAGNDIIDGGAGADRMEGGDQDDLYFVDDIGDSIIELDSLGAGGIDTVRSTISYTLSANVENLSLLGSADVNATGNGKANRLIGNDGANILDGGLGNDTMEGGLGNDIYHVNTSTDLVVEAAGAGKDTVQSSVTRTLEVDVEDLTLVGVAVINATGNAVGNILTGNVAANVLSGLDGDDLLFGGDGNDVLKGGAGADVLDGQAGADRMEGGDGDDRYFVEDSGDVVVELANAGLGGNDSVTSAVSYALTTNVENLTLLGTSAISGTGTNAANLIFGNDGANRLDSLAGNDRLQSFGGDDRLIGGSGTDYLDGGSGYDVAVFAGEVASYTVSSSNGVITIKDNDSVADGNDGTDTLMAVEVAEFRGGVTLDLLSMQNGSNFWLA